MTKAELLTLRIALRDKYVEIYFADIIMSQEIRKKTYIVIEEQVDYILNGVKPKEDNYKSDKAYKDIVV